MNKSVPKTSNQHFSDDVNEHQYDMYNKVNNYPYFSRNGNNRCFQKIQYPKKHNFNFALNTSNNGNSNQNNTNHVIQPHTPEIFIQNDKASHYLNNTEYSVSHNNSLYPQVLPKQFNDNTNLNNSVNYNRTQTKDLVNHNSQLSHSFHNLSVDNKVQQTNQNLLKPIANNSSSISLPQKLEQPKVTKTIESNKNFQQNEKSKSRITKAYLNTVKSVVNIMNQLNLVPEDGFNFPDITKFMMKDSALYTNPSIMHVSLTAIPATDDLLSKSRLPLGLLLQPYRDLSCLPVIRANKSIIRCRTLSCRAYLNSFIPFYDSKRWKCNMCLRMNDLTEHEQLITRFKQLSSKDSDNGKMIIPELAYSTYEYTTPIDPKVKSVKPPIFIFLVDTSNLERFKHQLSTLMQFLSVKLVKIPSENVAKISLICYNRYINLYQLSGHTYREITITDLDSINTDGLPVLDGLVNNVRENREAITKLFKDLSSQILEDPDYGCNEPVNCLGSALQVVKLIIDKYKAPSRVTIFNSSRPSIGDGVVDEIVTSTFPTINFYKMMGLDLAQSRVSVDLFQLSNCIWDISSVTIVTRYGGGTLYYYPNFYSSPSSGPGQLDRERLKSDLYRYLTRKIGLDAVLRVRYSSGITVQASYGNMFSRACDLYSIASINPDWTAGIRLGIDETGLSNVAYIQSALLYTSIGGEKRIRVHTICLPVSTRIEDVFRYADSRVILGLIAKMVSDRITTPLSAKSYNMSTLLNESREGLLNSVLDPVIAYTRFSLGPSQNKLDGINLPFYLRVLPLFIWALSRFLPPIPRSSYKNDPVTANLITRIVYNCTQWTNNHLIDIITYAYPSLYRIDGVVLPSSTETGKGYESQDYSDQASESSESSSPRYSSTSNSDSSSSTSPTREEESSSSRETSEEKTVIEYDEMNFFEGNYVWKPIQLQLNNRNLDCDGVYLIDMHICIGIIVCEKVSKRFLEKIFGVNELSELYMGDGSCYITELPQRDNPESQKLRSFIKSVQFNRPISSPLVVMIPSLLTNKINSELLNVMLYSSLLENSGCVENSTQSILGKTLHGSYLRFLQYIQKKLYNDIN